VDTFFVGALLVAATLAVIVCLALLARHLRRRGSTGAALGAAMAAYDEAMHSTAHNTYVEVQAQKDRTSPVESGGNL